MYTEAFFKDILGRNCYPNIMEHIIGVIGGIGPQAGLDFVQKILENTRANKDQDHLNCILASCPSIIPDRTAFLLLDEETNEKENPAFGMFESARRLYMAGVRYAAVACNTAHANRIFGPFCDMVKESLPELMIINMLESCAEYVNKRLPGNISRLGLLATIGTHKSGVYHEYFKEEEGFHLIEPDTESQKKIHEAIYNEVYGIKAHPREISFRAVEDIVQEIYVLIRKGAEAVILGCTELPLALQYHQFIVPLIDPGLPAARKLIELTSPEKLLNSIG